MAYFYFEGNKGLISVFDYDFDVDRILDELGNVIRGKEIIPGKTLVIFDEVQACPNALTSLKFYVPYVILRVFTGRRGKGNL